MEEKDISVLADKIDAKIQKFADEGKNMTEAAKAELKAEVSAMVEQYKTLNADFAKLQESVDSLNAEKKRFNMEQELSANFATKLNKELQGEDFKKYIERKRSGKKAQFEASFEGIDFKEITVSTHTSTTVPSQHDTTIRYEPDRRKHVRDLIPTAPTSSNRVVLTVEKTISDGTAVTEIGEAKGASQFTLEVETYPVMKIASAHKIPEEMLDDVPGLVSYITTRWGAKLKAKEDYCLLYNTPSSTEFGGLTTVAQVYVDTLADSLTSRWDVLRAAITQAIVDEYQPNAIMLHPTDVMHLRNVKDTTGQYVGMAAPWSPAQLMVDGVPVYTTTAIGVGEFLVGDFSMGAQIWDRKTPSIRFYDQDEDNAQKNLITVIVEERLTLSINRANAFVYGTFAEALAKGSA